MSFWSIEQEIMEYEMTEKGKNKYRDMVQFLLADFEKVYNGRGPDEADGQGPVHGSGMRQTFSDLTGIFADTLWPSRYGDDFIPIKPRPPPRSARERDQRYMAHYSKIFPNGHLEPAPSGLWAACSKRFDNRQLIKRAPPCIVEKYKCKDPLGLNEMPVNFPPPVQDYRVEPLTCAKQLAAPREGGPQVRAKPVIPSGSQVRTKPGFQARSKPAIPGSSPTSTVPVIPSHNIGISQDPAMEDLREAKSERDQIQVQKRLGLAVKRLEYFAKRQQAGCDVWVLKQGARIPETNCNKYWDSKKNVFVTIKNTKAVSNGFSSKKRPREDEGSMCRKKQCTGVQFQPKLIDPPVTMTPVTRFMPHPENPCVSGYTGIQTQSQKRSREEDASVSRKKQCTTSFLPRPRPPHQGMVQVPQAQMVTALPGTGIHQRQVYHHSQLNLPRPSLSTQNNVTTKMVHVPPSGQMSDLARFGLEYQLDIRPVD